MLSVIGVAKDFHHINIWFEDIKPFGIRHQGQPMNVARIRLVPSMAATTIGQMKAIWKEFEPNLPFSGFFYTERVYNMAKFFTMGSKIVGFVGFLTILISCMGLLGMVIYSVEGRVKEVGIRKVLGAGEGNLVWHLSKGFLLLLGIAIAIAVPLSMFGAKLWLNNFLLQVPLSFSLLLSGVSIMLALGGMTVVSQTFLAARKNPVHALKNE